MAESRWHAVFSPSAAGTLKSAFHAAGRPDEVSCPFDDFSFGPIAMSDSADRVSWVENALRIPGWEDVTDRTTAFLGSLRATSSPITAWLSRTDARSFAGFLWFLSHTADRPISVVDTPGISIMKADDLLRVLNRQAPLSSEDVARYRNQWKQLRRENAPLRVIDGDHLVSAGIDHFDTLILSHARAEWQKMARIIGGMLGEFSETGIYQTSDLFLFARLADLAEEGQLEWRGDLSHMQNCELRLPAASQS